MKILIDLTALADNFSGIERYAACIAYEMIQHAEYDEFILLFKEKVQSDFEMLALNDNVNTIILPRCNKLIFNQLRLPLAIRKCKADCYLFLAFPNPVLTFKKNMISAIHDICCWDCPETMTGKSKWYFRISYRCAIRRCRFILTVSDFSRQRIINRLHCKKERIHLIYDGVNKDFGSHLYSPEQKQQVKMRYHIPDKYIFSLSTLEPRKNFPLLLLAYQNLVKQCKIDIPLVLAGRKGWKMDDLIARIDEEVQKKIYFTGFVEEEDLPCLYQNAEMFVFPSKYEGFGIPPLEAMACGAPVLASNAASLPEVLGDAALYFESENQGSLEEGMLRILNLKPEARNRMIRDGIARAACFSWEKEALKLLEIIRENIEL